MDFKDFAYSIDSDKPFGQVLNNLHLQTAEHKFRVLAEHDVQATLAEKNFERGPLTILEVCNAGFAHQATQKNIGVAIFMPCRFAIYTENDKTVVTLGRPAMMSQIMPEAGLNDLANEVEKTLKSIMEKSV